MFKMNQFGGGGCLVSHLWDWTGRWAEAKGDSAQHARNIKGKRQAGGANTGVYV